MIFLLKKKFLLGCLSFLLPIIFISFGLFLLLFSIAETTNEPDYSLQADVVAYDGIYSNDLPIYDEIKGSINIPENVAKLAVGVGVKYQLLPSVVLSQWAYESEWGRSYVARNDNNFFGITWFQGAPYGKGSARGIGGSEGGNYVKFPNMAASFSYYGYMVASQSNFNQSVGNKSPSEVLLILGRGGYAASGITESSPYFTAAMAIIENNNLTKYDDFAIKRWQSTPASNSTVSGSVVANGNGTIDVLERSLGQGLFNGECYGLTAYYVQELGGPALMGSGYMFAERIGEDYDWNRYGWEVIMNPKPSDLQAGDVINWYAGGMLSPGIYGHTGVISQVNNDGSFQTYEQNAGKGRINAKYTRTFEMTRIRSLVRKK